MTPFDAVLLVAELDADPDVAALVLPEVRVYVRCDLRALLAGPFPLCLGAVRPCADGRWGWWLHWRVEADEDVRGFAPNEPAAWVALQSARITGGPGPRASS